MNVEHYIPADIGFVVAGANVQRIMNSVFTPCTDLFHAFVIYEYLPDEDDYVIIESRAGFGFRITRLSKYDQYMMFRISDPEIASQGYEAVRLVTQIGESRYDLPLVFSILRQVLSITIGGLFHGRWPHKINAKELKYTPDDRYICTETASETWKTVNYYIVPKGTIPLPSAYQEVINNGKLLELERELV